MKKRILLISLVVLLLTFAMVAVACNKKPPEEPVTPITDVNVGTKDVSAALKEAVGLRDASAYYIAFQYEIDKGKDEYNTLVDFAAVIDSNDATLTPQQYEEGLDNTKLSLRVSNAIQGDELWSVNYFGGNLYVNYPYTVTNAILRNVPLVDVANYLHASAYNSDGTLRTIFDLLPTLGNNLFESCLVETDTEAGTGTYTFGVSKSSLQEMLSFLSSYTVGLADLNDLYTLLGLDRQLTDLDDTTIQMVFHVAIDGSVKTFKQAEIVKTSGETVLTNTLRNFECERLAPNTISQYVKMVTTADMLSRYTYYHPANLELHGTLTLDLSTISTEISVWQTPILAAFSNDDRLYDMDLVSNFGEDGEFVFDLALTAHRNRDHHLELYYAQGVLYADLSAYGLGKWQMTNNTLQDAVSKLKGSYAYEALAADDVRDIVLDVLTNRIVQGNVTTYTLTGEHATALFNSLQNTLTGGALHVALPLTLRSASVDLTQTGSFSQLRATLSATGVRLIVDCKKPTVGKTTAPDAPAWLADCIDPEDQEQYTLTASGSVKASTLILKTTRLLETYLASISGTEVDLGDTQITAYRAAVNLTDKGALRAFMLDMYADAAQQARICTLYYHIDAVDKLFVILPASEGHDVVQTLSLKIEDRYTAFLQAIGSVSPINSNLPACKVSTTADAVTISWSTAGLAQSLRRLSEVMPNLTYKALPTDAFVQQVDLTLGADAALQVIFADNRYVRFGLDSIGIDDYGLDVHSSLGSKNVSLFDKNDLPDLVQVQTVYADGTQRNLTLSLRELGSNWQYDRIPSVTDAETVVSATCRALGQNATMKLIVDCHAPTDLTLSGGGDYADKLDENRHFNFKRYTDGNVLSNTFDAFDRVTFKIYGKQEAASRDLVWLRGGKPLSLANFDTPDRDVGDTSYYDIVPAITGYFGNLIALGNDTYSICLTGAKIAGVQSATNLLTLQAYSGTYRPFLQDTYEEACLAKYGQRTPIFLDGANEQVAVTNVSWNVDGIENLPGSGGVYRDGVALTTAQLQQALATELYALGGKYIIRVTVADSLGGEMSWPVQILIMPKIVQSITFLPASLADGISFMAGAQDSDGNFAIESARYEAIHANFVFASSVKCTFTDGTEHTFDAKDWTCTPQKQLSLFRGASGSVVLAVGDEVGGKQERRLTYSVAGMPVSSVALWYYDDEGDPTVWDASKQTAQDSTAAVTFDMTGDNAVDPYAFRYPQGLAVIGQDATRYLAHTWSFGDWAKISRQLWRTDTVYTAQDSVFNLNVNIRLAFVNKVVKSWEFVSSSLLYEEDVQGIYVKSNTEYVPYDPNEESHKTANRYNPAYVVAKAPVYEQAASGAYVIVDGHYVPYDEGNEAHAALARYNRVGNTTYNVLYRYAAGVWRLVMDPNQVNVRVADAYPAQVRVTFADDTTATLATVWDLSAIQNLSAAETYKGTVGLSIALEQKLDDIYMSVESVTDAQKYVTVTRDEQNKIIGGRDIISVSVIGESGGAPVFHDLTDVHYLHGLICNCADPDCLGKIYFVYDNSDNQDTEFSITEWRGLEKVRALFEGAASVEKVEGTVTVYAIANNIACPITIDVVASPLLNVQFHADGMPAPVSSMFTNGESSYSMNAVEPDEPYVLGLSIDPYLANIRLGTCYPTLLQCKLGDTALKCTIDRWDLSALNAVAPYQGIDTGIACALATPMGDVRLTVQVHVVPRIIRTVLIDGQDTHVLTVDAYSDTPFGSDLYVVGERKYAYKTVRVQFEQDDQLYYMIMRYDITDIRATYASAQLRATPITIEVGSESGGFQSLPNYYLFSSANQVLRIRCDLTGLGVGSEGYQDLIAYFGAGWDGVLYQNDTFVTFDDTEKGNAAWRALTVLCDSLIVETGYMINGQYVLYQSGDGQRYRVDAYDYVADPAGAYVFTGSEFTAYDAMSAQHVGLPRYSLRAITATPSASGSYVLSGDTFIPYYDGSASQAGLPRYDLPFADTNVYLQQADGGYVFVNGAFVAYASEYSGYTRFAIVAQNTFGFVEEEGGNYVNVDNAFVIYNSEKNAHQGKTHYSLVPDTPYVYVVDEYGDYVVVDGALTLYLSDEPTHEGLLRYRPVSYRYVADNAGAFVYTAAHPVTNTFTALSSRTGNGLVYQWLRGNYGGGSNVVLQLYNQNAIFSEHLASEQIINTYMSRPIRLTNAMLTLPLTIVDGTTTLAYSGATVASFIATYKATAVYAERFSVGDLTYALYTAGDTRLADDAVLHVGTYTLRIGVNNSTLYGGTVDITVVIEPATLDTVTVVVSGRSYGLSTMEDSVTVTSLTELRVLSGTEDVTVTRAFFAGETPLATMPYQDGTYTVVLNCDNADYTLPRTQFTLIIRVN